MNAAYCIVLGLAIAVEGGGCSAQETPNTLQLPPATHMRTDLPLAGDNAAIKAPSGLHPEIASAGVGIVAPAAPVALRGIADSKFFIMNGIHLGMAVFDVEMTQHCIASHRCREANPVMPSSQVGQLSVNFALVAYSSGVSYWLKRRKSKLWWLPPSAGAAVHSVGVATGFEHQ
jgi:hypothetical protein